MLWPGTGAGIVISSAFVEPATMLQFVDKPTEFELVCASKRQPVWSVGQDNWNVPFVLEIVRCGWVVEGAT